MPSSANLPPAANAAEALTRAAVVAGGLLLLAWLTPWRRPPPPRVRPPPEPALTEQVAAVRARNVDQIALAAQAATDADLAQFSELPALRILLLDQAGNQLSARGLGLLARLPHLSQLRVQSPPLSDAELAAIAQCQSLEVVTLSAGRATGAGLEKLAALPRLVQLRLEAPRLTADDLTVLRKFPALKRLHLIDAPVGDRGLAVLGRLEGLESLYLDGAEFSEQALAALFAARPQLHVHLNQQHHARDPGRHAHRRP